MWCFNDRRTATVFYNTSCYITLKFELVILKEWLEPLTGESSRAYADGSHY